MPRKRPYVASMDQVRISREGDYAVIEYADPEVGATHFKLGAARLRTMTDEDILAHFNGYIEARDEFMEEYEHECVEIPPGRPQVEYNERCRQWVPRGDVVRGIVVGGEEERPAIEVDGRELSWEEFGSLVSVFSGWGFRLCFVPDDELHEAPTIVVRDKDEADA